MRVNNYNIDSICMFDVTINSRDGSIEGIHRNELFIFYCAESRNNLAIGFTRNSSFIAII